LGRKKQEVQLSTKATVNKAGNRRKQQRFRDKIKNDPDKYEAWKRKEHETYLKRKAEGKIKWLQTCRNVLDVVRGKSGDATRKNIQIWTESC